MHASKRAELAMSVPHFSYSQKCLAKKNVGGKCDSKMPGNMQKGALPERMKIKLMMTYYRPGTVLSILYLLAHLILSTTLRGRMVIFPI